MRVLLDTHALLWALEDNPKLSNTARAVIVDLDNEILVSVTSAIEIAIKKGMGKLKAPSDLASAVDQAGFISCVLTFEVANKLETLPPHHRDPFDRLLIAQALKEGVPIITCDEQMHDYNVQVIW